MARQREFKVAGAVTDFSKPSYSIKLKIKISGQGILFKAKILYDGPFTLQPGTPVEISGSDYQD